MRGFSHSQRHPRPARTALADRRAWLASAVAADAGWNRVEGIGNDLTFDCDKQHLYDDSPGMGVLPDRWATRPFCLFQTCRSEAHLLAATLSRKTHDFGYGLGDGGNHG